MIQLSMCQFFCTNDQILRHGGLTILFLQKNCTFLLESEASIFECQKSPNSLRFFLKVRSTTAQEEENFEAQKKYYDLIDQ